MYEPGPHPPRCPQPGSISPPPHAPMRRRLCFCAGLNPSLAGGYFCGFGGDPKRRPRASFSLCQEPDTLSRVGMASGRCRFLPQPLTGTDWSEGGGGPRLSQQTGVSAFCRLFTRPTLVTTRKWCAGSIELPNSNSKYSLAASHLLTGTFGSKGRWGAAEDHPPCIPLPRKVFCTT